MTSSFSQRRRRRVLSFFVFFTAFFGTGALEAAQPVTGRSNPDLSVNFLGLAQYGTGLSSDRTEGSRNGLQLQEAELQLTSDVDAYLRASALLAVGQEEGAWGIDPEEVFVETLTVPGVTLKAGKFKLALGRHNLMHTHAYPFIDAPLAHQVLTGEEGLNEVGLSAAVLIPASWYSELTLQAFDLSNEALFASPSSGNLGGLAHVKNLFELSDDTTMEVGLSGTAGRNAYSKVSALAGLDLTFKWRPSEGGKYHALIWSTEYLLGHRAGAPVRRLGGAATWLQYQFDERWWVQARVERLGLPGSDALPVQNKQSALLAFLPSEFSGFRLQYDHLATNGAKDGHTLALQYNVTIGAHPAHAY